MSPNPQPLGSDAQYGSQARTNEEDGDRKGMRCKSGVKSTPAVATTIGISQRVNTKGCTQMTNDDARNMMQWIY